MTFVWAIPLLWDYIGNSNFFFLMDEKLVFLATLLVLSVFFLCYDTKLEVK